MCPTSGVRVLANIVLTPPSPKASSNVEPLTSFGAAYLGNIGAMNLDMTNKSGAGGNNCDCNCNVVPHILQYVLGRLMGGLTLIYML